MSRLPSRIRLGLFGVLILGGCGVGEVGEFNNRANSSNDGGNSMVGSELIYDEDGRCNVGDCSSRLFAELATGSAVAIVPRERLRLKSDGTVQMHVSSLREGYDFCDSEIPFGDEPILAECTGVLVAPDLVLTAGHCVDDEQQCASNYVVFNYATDHAGALALQSSDVFECAGIEARELSDRGASEVYDHALLRLHAPAIGRRAARVRTTVAATGEPVVLIGNGEGLPTKLDENGIVTSPGGPAKDYFTAQIDNFERGSGSPVFDADGMLLGIAVRGGVDYDTKDTCYRLRRVEGASGLSEHVSYAYTALRRIAATSGIDVTMADASSSARQSEYFQLQPEGGCSVGSGVWDRRPWILVIAVSGLILLRRRRNGRGAAWLKAL